MAPTRLGVAFLGLIVVTLIGCINYALSLGYGITFLLGGVWVVAAAHATRAGRSLEAALDAPAEAVAGTEAAFTARLSHRGGRRGPGLTVRVQARAGQGQPRVTVWVPAGGTLTARLPVPAGARGQLTLTRPEAVVLDPLGLWEVRRDLPPPEPLPVFPAPERDAPSPPVRSVPGAGEQDRRVSGDEEFSGLRPYLPGDSPRQVSWRHAARTGALLTRETDAPAGAAALALNWADTAALGDPEARLSRLAAWVGAARRAGTPFSLNLPGRALPVGAGEGHARAALAQLAAFPPVPAAPLPPRPRPRPKKLPPPPLPGAPLRFTLFALAVALAPAALRQPWWLTALIVGVLGYSAARTRVARTRRRLPAPHPALLGLAAGAGLVLLNASFGTLLGRDAGTALLGLLVALKAAETRTRRDARLLALLGVFVTLTHFFFGQGPLAAAHALLSVGLLLAALVAWTVPPPAAPTPAHSPLRPAAALTLQALPLAALLFVLFPRPDAPLWQLPVQDAARTGLADQVSAGDFASLAQNRAVAFRADFAGALPDPAQRYWRGPVYEAYDGLRWTQVRVPGAAPSLDPFGPTLSYTLALEPSGKPWLLALDTPTALPPGALLTTAFQAVTPRPAATRTRLSFQSRAARLGVREDPGRLNFALHLPEGESPRARALGLSWRTLPPPERVEAALAFLRAGGFTYTLTPPTLPQRDRVDAFLFGTRAGFCEHYASAFAVLLRAAGLPTRLVGGYLGGEPGLGGDYLIVRQQDAHAWTEVWLPGQGWVRVDPTAVVAPARVNAGLDTALTRPAATAAPPPDTLRRAALRLDALQTRWNTWVAGYDGGQQRALLARVGLGGVGGSGYLVAGAGLLALALLPTLLTALRRPRPADPAARLLDDLTRRLRLPRAPGETPGDYARRAAQKHPAQAAAIAAAVAAYHAARYGLHPGAAELRALRTAVRRVRRRG
nr:transglutaminaseTgpA domain-containing protein [Deinococcus budaensis]